jgi:hypothetical protein
VTVVDQDDGKACEPSCRFCGSVTPRYITNVCGRERPWLFERTRQGPLLTGWPPPPGAQSIETSTCKVAGLRRGGLIATPLLTSYQRCPCPCPPWPWPYPPWP